MLHSDVNLATNIVILHLCHLRYINNLIYMISFNASFSDSELYFSFLHSGELLTIGWTLLYGLDHVVAPVDGNLFSYAELYEEKSFVKVPIPYLYYTTTDGILSTARLHLQLAN